MVVLKEFLYLSAATYTSKQRSGRWQRTARFERRRGFHATLWRATDTPDAVLSVRGTKGVKDGLQDLRLLLGREPLAWREGRDVLKQAKSYCGSRGQLYLTGHSIGGAYASALGLESQTPTVTFNAPGMRVALGRSKTNASWLEHDPVCVLNVCSSGDFIWRLSGPGLSSKVLILSEGHHSSIRRTGVRGVLEAWCEEGSAPQFVRNAIRRHGLRGFTIQPTGAPWNRHVDELMLQSEQKEHFRESCANTC